MADVQAVLAALAVFSQAPDKVALDQANTFLQDFQHSPEAWTICNDVLSSSADNLGAAKLFAAQTLRAKVTYDLFQVDPVNLPALRDTLLNALKNYYDGPKTILVQLSLALSGLALQMPGWLDPVQTLVEKFGRNPATVPTLLQFLTILPEELTSNSRIPVTNEEYNVRSEQLLTNKAKDVLELLTMYIQAPGVTIIVQTQIFACLRSWLLAGEVNMTDLSQTPLFGFVFQALASDELFDAAVDVLQEMIHETQEVDDNMNVIQLIVPKVIALKDDLGRYNDDPDRIRGYARIFAEAGEVYRSLLIHHPEMFFPIVEAIGQCSAYSDLDIVPITFPFWSRLAATIGKRSSVSPLFQEAYRSLMVVIIGHLHFPADQSSMVGQELEAFRSFRHVMGDTLKDCCLVLGTETCLLTAYQIITTALSRGPDTLSWQEIEAPLFSLRSMGAEINIRDDNAVPKIMDLIPALPNHPRVRYAALLIIARYTEWINLHPNYLPFQLQYISAGFEDSDAEVCAASGTALKYLCQDCKEHLSDFLPSLHTFLTTTGGKLVQDDKRQVYEAVALIISGMPMERAAEALRTFSLDILSQVHTIASKPTPATVEELAEVSIGLENLETMLHVVQSFGEELPPACQGTCEQAWSFFDTFLEKYGSDYGLAERATRVLRQGLNLFGTAALPVAASIVHRMGISFESFGLPSYLWIAGKVLSRFGYEEDSGAMRTSFRECYERSTHKVVALLQIKTASQMPDVLEDYIQMLLQMIEFAPDHLFESSVFPLAFQATMASLTLIHTEVIFAALDLLRLILTHDCLLPSPSLPPKFPIYAQAIRGVVDKTGFELVGLLVTGVTGDFPEDSVSIVVSIFRVFVGLWPSELLNWLPPALQQLPASAANAPARAQFLEEVTSAIQTSQYDKVKHAIITLHRQSRKQRDRRKTGPLDTSR